MVQAPGDALRLDAGRGQEAHDLRGQLRASLMGILGLVVLRREPVEAGSVSAQFCEGDGHGRNTAAAPTLHLLVDELGMLGGVDQDRVRFPLPVTRENNYSLRLHLLRYLLPDTLKNRVYRMFGLILHIWLGRPYT